MSTYVTKCKCCGIEIHEEIREGVRREHTSPLCEECMYTKKEAKGTKKILQEKEFTRGVGNE